MLCPLILLALSGCSPHQIPSPQKFSAVVVRTYPHDPQAFTQGLAWDNGLVFESTGQECRSTLRLVELQTGAIEQQVTHEEQIFAEGITVFHDKIFQLTWKNNILFIYDKHDFSLRETREYSGEGWGITHDGHSLIVSDGSATLSFLDPDTLARRKEITVHDRLLHINNLNELEYVHGKIWANVWQTDRIAIINPDNGGVEGWLDLAGLRASIQQHGPLDVLNGILYDPQGDRVFVTGKLWPALFEIRLLGED